MTLEGAGVREGVRPNEASLMSSSASVARAAHMSSAHVSSPKPKAMAAYSAEKKVTVGLTPLSKPAGPNRKSTPTRVPRTRASQAQKRRAPIGKDFDMETVVVVDDEEMVDMECSLLPA